MEPGQIPQRVEVDLGNGEVLRFQGQVPGRVCRECGESLISGEAWRQFDLAVAQHLARHGVSAGSAFRFMRKAIGLPAREFAELYGVATETVSRWETGKLDVPRAAFLVLGTMVEDTIAKRSGIRDRAAAVLMPKRSSGNVVDVEVPAVA